ncbi:DUF6680 family protein [Geojedonia litorea]|uniref:DUF6680 family protein n=1 Tax=Geojedonia litorea TaxID=1268269 RepID=A0ABV9N7Y4_9FLAO
MEFSDMITIAAILLSPLIAVQVTRLIDKKREVTNRQMDLFRVLMGQRGLTPRTDEYVIALNQIDAVFHDVPKIREAYTDLYKATSPNSPEISDSGKYLIVLLREMSKHLRFGNIDDLDIDRYYTPQSRSDGQKLVNEYYTEFLRVLKSSERF